MIKGLAITPPVIGRISTGTTVEKNGKRMPCAEDQFTITTQVQNRDGWMLHPLNETLRKETAGKLRAIPVRFLFNDPDLNLRAEYSCFDRETGRPVCVGDGSTCRRAGDAGIEELPCSSPDSCTFGRGGACKPYGRLSVRVGDEGEMGCFILRTASYNTIRTLAARLHYFSAVSGNLLACLPLELKIRAKSTAQSFRAAIYYVDLGVRTGSTLEAAITEARELDARRKSVGFDQVALDAAARAGFGNGAFEESIEDGAAVVDEFYPSRTDGSGDHQEARTDGNRDVAIGAAASTLRGKLEHKAASLGGAAA